MIDFEKICQDAKINKYSIIEDADAFTYKESLYTNELTIELESLISIYSEMSKADREKYQFIIHRIKKVITKTGLEFLKLKNE